MANRKTKIKSHPIRSSPLTDAEWTAVVAELELSPQQARIVQLVLQGFGNKQIAFAMHLHESTVRTYLGRIFQRLNVADRLELAIRIFTINRGLCQPLDRHLPG